MTRPGVPSTGPGQDSGAPLHAAILVGGASRRMGQPKQLLRHGDVTLVERAVAAVECLVDGIVLAGSGQVPETLELLDRLPDPPGIGGPIAGVLAAMRWAPRSAWVIAACDMPAIRRQAVEWLLAQRGPEVLAVLPRTSEHRVEPLFAVYEPDARGMLEQRVRKGRFGFQKLAVSDEVACPVPPPDLGDAWVSVNTMEEFLDSSVFNV